VAGFVLWSEAQVYASLSEAKGEHTEPERRRVTILFMFANIALFFVSGVIAYLFISFFGQITGSGTKTIIDAVRAVLKPLPLLVLLIGNVFFAITVFSGFKVTQFAIPAAIALGVIVSFFYSVFFLGGTVTALKAFGVVLILAGIFFLR